MVEELKILPTGLLEQYIVDFDHNYYEDYKSLVDSELSIETFSFYTSVSAVFSSKIEGEHIELDSFIKHKRFGIAYQPDYTRKIDDLYETYLFAQKNELNAVNISIAHAKITQNILKKSQQGTIRSSNMFVITNDGKIEYIAAAPHKVESEIFKFYEDLDILINANLTFVEIFFFASMLHLLFLKIHPFDDGNGRMARLIEKWFLATKLGNNAWFLQSEKNYYLQHETYYHNIRRLGLDYEQLDYDASMAFLKMLPQAIVLAK